MDLVKIGVLGTFITDINANLLRYSLPVTGISSPSLFLGFAFFIFLNLYKAWIQRRPGMDTEMARRGYSDVLFLGLHLKKKPYTERGYSDGQAWIQRQPGVDTETDRHGYSDSLDI